jgi:hypothetical protein
VVLNAGSLLKVAACSEIPQSFASKYALDNSKISADNTRISMPALISQSLDLEHKAYENLRSSRDGLDTQTTLSGHIRTLEGLMTREGIRLNMPHDIGGINVNIFSHKWFEGISTKVKNKKELIIRPISPSSTRIKLFAEVEDFKTLRYNAQQKNPEPSLMINQGMVSIVAQPYFALDKRTVTEEQPSYSIATPVVKFEHIRVEEAHLVFKGAHLTIPMYCEDASLKAHNGRYKNEGNYIEGRIKFKIANASNAVSEDLVRVAIKHQALVPDYNQDDFDKSYAKTDYLERVLSAE